MSQDTIAKIWPKHHVWWWWDAGWRNKHEDHCCWGVGKMHSYQDLSYQIRNIQMSQDIIAKIRFIIIVWKWWDAVSRKQSSKGIVAVVLIRCISGRFCHTTCDIYKCHTLPLPKYAPYIVWTWWGAGCIMKIRITVCKIHFWQGLLYKKIEIYKCYKIPLSQYGPDKVSGDDGTLAEKKIKKQARKEILMLCALNTFLPGSVTKCEIYTYHKIRLPEDAP